MAAWNPLLTTQGVAEGSSLEPALVRLCRRHDDRIVTGDHTRITVPNGSLFSGTLKNFTVMGTRRVDLKMDLGDRSLRPVMAELLMLVGRHSKVLATPKPTVQLLGLAMRDRTMVSVRAWCQTGDYDAVKGDLLLMVKE